MLNAHLRFGWLNFIKLTDRKTTSFRVRLDRFIAEPPENRNQSARAHLISVIGGDTQIAAISAGLAEGGHFSIEGPDIEPVRVWLGETKPQTYRATLSLPGRRRPARHLIALSQEIAGSTIVARVVLIDSRPEFVWQAVAKIFGLPGVPEWASWFYEQLEWRNAITPLLGVGCSPILIKGSREEYLSWLAAGARDGTLVLPEENRAIKWPSIGLEQVLEPADGDMAQELRDSFKEPSGLSR
jgi:hypothetical protein